MKLFTKQKLILQLIIFDKLKKNRVCPGYDENELNSILDYGFENSPEYKLMIKQWKG